MLTRFDHEVVRTTGPEYVQAKLAERDERHAKAGESRYLVEPNVKDGKGGLRDLQTLFWIGKYFYRVRTGEELVDKGVFTEAEYREFLKAEDFLWAVRCHMHFLTGKPEERLHFDIQREIAERLGYTTHPGLSAVERFMKHYFLVAKDVGDLTRIFCAALEEEQAKHVPGFNRIFLTFQRRKRKLAGTSDFIVDNHRINIADDQVFERDPVNLLRLFWFADKHGLEFHPDALKLLTRSLGLVDKSLRRDEEANRLFLDILTSDRNAELNLRRMNEAGLLGKLIPDFGKIVAMMQFSMYHHYTVDEHLIRCIGVLAEIERGDGEKVHPLSHTLMPGLKKSREALYVAVLLHDIAKGRPEDHSEAGARIARRICPHMGLSAADTETVAWLVENHLVMSMTAQTRDLNDRKTIEDFAAIVQSVERLKMLLILTVCDIRGVGPGVWNGWKGQLLRTLYYETELLLTGGFSEVSRAQRTAAARERLAEALADWPDKARKRYVGLHYENYLLTVDLADQLRHAEFIREADAAGKKLATMVKTHQFEAVTEITVLAQDHPRLLSVIAGACAGAGGNIVDAQIFTTSDGRALDTILISQGVRPRRGRAPPRRARRPADRGRAVGQELAAGDDREAHQAAARRQGVQDSAARRNPQHAVEPLLGDRGRGAGPAGPAVGDHRSAVGPVARHRLGPHHHLRRKGHRHLLRHRPHRPEDRQPGAHRRHPQPADRGARRHRARARRQGQGGRRVTATITLSQSRRQSPRRMSLVKKFATVASGTLMSRALGFGREMLMAAALGTGPVADAFNAAFQFPNTFRRLFAEGAFNAAFVPLFAKEIETHGTDGAKRFSEEVFGVLFTALLALTIVMELAMPLIVRYLVAPGFADTPGKFETTVALATIMFPYLICMSLGAMMAGMLNSLRRYFAAAVAPVFLNIILIGVLAYAWYKGSDARDRRLRAVLGRAGGGAGATRHRLGGGAPCRHLDRLSPAEDDAQRQAAADPGAAGGDHRRHHPDQPADRHGDRLGAGQRRVLARLCRPHLPAAARRRRRRRRHRAVARTVAGAEVGQSDRSGQSAEPLGRVHAVPDLAGGGGTLGDVGADRAAGL